MDAAEAAKAIADSGGHAGPLIALAVVLMTGAAGMTFLIVKTLSTYHSAKQWVLTLVSEHLPTMIRNNLQNGVREMVAAVVADAIKTHERVEQEHLVKTIIPTVTGCRDEIEHRMKQHTDEAFRRLDEHDRRLGIVEADLLEAIRKGKKR
jgi:hypothetical protein